MSRHRSDRFHALLRQAGTLLMLALLAGGAILLYNWMMESAARPK